MLASDLLITSVNIILGPGVASCTSESAGLPVVAKKNYHCTGAKKGDTWLTDVLPAAGRTLLSVGQTGNLE